MRDFYRHQEHALVQTARLVTILGVALGGTVLLSAVGIGYIVVVFNVIEQVPVDLWTAFIETFAVSVPVISVVIAVGSFIKIYQLRGGGSVVAEQLGGTLISDGHADASHRKVLNIVEEIAIASGVLVPPVYVMEGEPGINAFAAGYSHHDAVIAVTRGCIDRLSREQLQGVIAHEFSHIFNGDMRLNIRAIGVLHGILTLTLLAEWFIHEGLKIMATGGRGRRDGTFVGVAFVICGAIIWPIGTVGLVLSLVIKSAINRQREYLADASAVEFTRNPAGLAGALKVIGGYAVGGRVRNPSAVEASHLFFTDGCRGFSRLFHSHPPLEDRIKRIEPDWDGVHLFEEERDIAPYGGAFQGTMNLIGGSSRPRAQQVDRTTLSAERDEEIEEACAWSVHNEEMLSTIPPALLELTQDKIGARVTLLTTWLANSRDANRAKQLSLIPEALRPAVEAFLELVATLEDFQQILLFDTALGALDRQSGAELEGFLRDVDHLLKRSQIDGLFQWAWFRLVTQYLGDRLGVERAKPRYGTLEPVSEHVEALLSFLVHAGQPDGGLGEYTFRRACSQLRSQQEFHFLRCDMSNVLGLLEIIDVALDHCSKLAARPRRDILLASGACITADRDISWNEALLIRVICSALNYPLPTLLPGQPVTPGA